MPYKQEHSQKTFSSFAPDEAEVRNGVRRHGDRSIKCKAVWLYLDSHPDATIAEMKNLAIEKGWNLENTKIEFYQWRKFHGLSVPRGS